MEEYEDTIKELHFKLNSVESDAKNSVHQVSKVALLLCVTRLTIGSIWEDKRYSVFYFIQISIKEEVISQLSTEIETLQGQEKEVEEKVVSVMETH